MRHTLSPRIAKTHFHPNIMNDISESIETCFFMILHENLIICSHLHFFQFLVEFSSLYMILVIHPIFQVCEFKHFLNSNLYENRKSSRKLLKIHNQDSIMFSSLLFFKLSSCDSSTSLITSKWWIFKSC